MDRTYSPDNVGNISAVSDHLDATRSQNFTYDDLYRLTSASGIYGTIAYTYDKVGNRRSRTRTGTHPARDTYHYYAGSNRLHTVVGDHAELLAYDAHGNTTRRTPGANNPTPIITDPADYIYNSAGQRVIKAKAADVIYHYDPSGQLIAETDGIGNLIKAYVWLHGQPLAMIDADGSIYYYHNDHLGTPQKMTDAAANVVWAADYFPFGKADVIVATVENNLRFAGQYYDQETGLHYNYHRYYDPKLGRFLRPDPSHSVKTNKKDSLYLDVFLLAIPQEFNLYQYCLGNPVNLVDPTGLMGRHPGKAKPGIPFYPPDPPPCDPHKYCSEEYNKKLLNCALSKNPMCITNAKLWLENCLMWAGRGKLMSSFYKNTEKKMPHLRIVFFCCWLGFFILSVHSSQYTLCQWGLSF